MTEYKWISGPKKHGIDFKIPGLTLVSSANASQHWATKSKRNKKQCLAVKYFLNQVMLPMLPVKITLTRISPRKLDSDNLAYAFKAIRDFIAKQYFPDSKLGMADDYPCFEWHYAHCKDEVREYAIRIQIEEIYQEPRCAK